MAFQPRSVATPVRVRLPSKGFIEAPLWRSLLRNCNETANNGMALAGC